jgi:hypothetical protein
MIILQLLIIRAVKFGQNKHNKFIIGLSCLYIKTSNLFKSKILILILIINEK